MCKIILTENSLDEVILTDKNEKVHSAHVSAMKIIGKKRLVSPSKLKFARGNFRSEYYIACAEARTAMKSYLQYFLYPKFQV